MNILEFASDALIFVCGPCSAGKNLEWISVGFGYLSFAATSRVRRKYGSWSIAHGMRQGMSERVPKMLGNEFENDGAAWIEQKWIFPMLSLQDVIATIQRGCSGCGCVITHESLNPNVAFAWLMVI